MKKLLILLIALPLTVSAQKAEFGITGGISMNGKASSNMPFQGDKSGLNYAASFIYVRNIREHLQLGLDLYIHELSSKNASATYNWQGRIIPKGDTRKLEYARIAASPSIIANYKVKVAEDAYVYGGAALGLVTTLNNSKKVNSTYSYSAPSGAIGGSGGLQLGFTYAITTRFTANAELAMRYYYLSYDSPAPDATGSEKLHYSILSTPFTIGIRYRIGFQKRMNYETGKYELINPNIKAKFDPAK